MSLLSEARRAVKLGRIRPTRRLGQSLAINRSFLRRMVDYAKVGKDDVVTEIGAGIGFLTRELALTGGRVVALEIDVSFVRVLKDNVSRCKNVEIVMSDALHPPLLRFSKVVSNPPYHISSKLLFTLLRKDFEVAVLTLQSEFAQRLSATPGSKDYGRLTVTFSYKAQGEILEMVPRGSFFPRPDVDSAVVKIVSRRPDQQATDEDLFYELTRALFTQRNKKVRNAITNFARERLNTRDRQQLAAVVTELPFGQTRVRRLTVQDVVILSNFLTEAIRSRRFNSPIK